jgi:hypothetical protein
MKNICFVLAALAAIAITSSAVAIEIPTGETGAFFVDPYHHDHHQHNHHHRHIDRRHHG